MASKMFLAVVIVVLGYIGLSLILSANSLVGDTPVYNTSDPVAVNASKQMDGFLDLGSSIGPGLLLLGGGIVVIWALLNKGG